MIVSSVIEPTTFFDEKYGKNEVSIAPFSLSKHSFSDNVVIYADFIVLNNFIFVVELVYY